MHTPYLLPSYTSRFIVIGSQIKEPADFDFKLQSLAQGFRSLSEFADHLTTSVDIFFPVIHGQFGEDGGIQELLERANVPCVGTRFRECYTTFDKSGRKETILYLTKFVDKGVQVKLTGGRQVTGTLKGYDQLLNLVLDEAVEYLRG